jgi:hypothetical protein
MFELATDAATMDRLLASAAGGALIGTAAAALLVVNGRVLGASGIVNGILDRAAHPGHGSEPGDLDWRLALVVGVIAGALLVDAILAGGALAAAAPRTGFPVWALVVAGLLVGAGTRIGSGCTSGHGICGIARLSPRSLVATATFMVAGIATVWVLRHLLAVLP